MTTVIPGEQHCPTAGVECGDDGLLGIEAVVQTFSGHRDTMKSE